MTKDEEAKLERTKCEALINIKKLQPRIVRVGNYLSSLQYRLGELMNEYHHADRVLANWKKIEKIEAKKHKLETIEDLVDSESISYQDLQLLFREKLNELYEKDQTIPLFDYLDIRYSAMIDLLCELMPSIKQNLEIND